MKRKKLEKILDEREARKEAKNKWVKYQAKTEFIVKTKIAAICIMCSIFFLVVFVWASTTTQLTLFIQLGAVFHLMADMLIIILFFIFGLEPIASETRERRKNKFAEKFPDDAKYLE